MSVFTVTESQPMDAVLNICLLMQPGLTHHSSPSSLSLFILWTFSFLSIVCVCVCASTCGFLSLSVYLHLFSLSLFSQCNTTVSDVICKQSAFIFSSLHQVPL